MREPVVEQVLVAEQVEGVAPVVQAAVEEQQEVGGRSPDRGVRRAGFGAVSEQAEAVGAQADLPVAVNHAVAADRRRRCK